MFITTILDSTFVRAILNHCIDFRFDNIRFLSPNNTGFKYEHRPEVRSRMNTDYMVCYFIGGMLGFANFTYLFSYYGWIAIVVSRILLELMGIIYWLFYTKTYS